MGDSVATGGVAVVVETFAEGVVTIGWSVLLLLRGIAVGIKKGDSVEGELVLAKGESVVIGAMVVGALVKVVTVVTGACVGICVATGRLVGRGVGAGASVGDRNGRRVGLEVGACVGNRVGRRVGLGVGACVGNRVGRLVGRGVGERVGRAVGGRLSNTNSRRGAKAPFRSSRDRNVTLPGLSSSLRRNPK